MTQQLSAEIRKLVLDAFDEGRRQEMERCRNIALDTGYASATKLRRGDQIAEDIAIEIRSSFKAASKCPPHAFDTVGGKYICSKCGAISELPIWIPK